MAQLPSQPYEPGIDASNGENSCQICISNFQRGEMLKTLPCFHRYHTECIHPWLEVRNRAVSAIYVGYTDDWVHIVQGSGITEEQDSGIHGRIMA